MFQTERNEIYKELEEFKLDDFTEEADCEDEGESPNSQTDDSISVSYFTTIFFLIMAKNSLLASASKFIRYYA